MKTITVNPKRFDAIKDEVFARVIEQNTEAAIKTVVQEAAIRAIFSSGRAPEVLTEADSNGDIWIGNDRIRVKFKMDQFGDELAAEIASNI